MKQGLSLRVSQHLALTPQLQQSIRLLQLSTLELSQEVEQMLDDNPFLEVLEEAAAREEFGLSAADLPARADEGEVEARADTPADAAASADVLAAPDNDTSADGPSDWEGDGSVDFAPDDGEWGGEAPARQRDDDSADAIELARSAPGLTEHLHQQALSLRLEPVDRAALRFLVESLNDDGYLEDSLAELARSLSPQDEAQAEELIHRFTVALGLLQSLEPVGVGARDLAECLRLQLQARLRAADAPADEAQTACLEAALRLCRLPMEMLARRDVRRMVQMAALSEAQVRAALVLIARLEPKPGRRFVNTERQIVVPDVIVAKVGRGASAKLQVRLNTDVMPKLRVHDVYASALRQHKGEGSQALQQRLQEARWFIKNIQQRFDTILRVSNAIVERQKNFFVHGELAMRPLVLREIADELGLHESTISRVTTAKYMATPFGTFELKYFFGSALGTETGGNASSTAVRALIRQFVAAENATKPLSDNQISDMLREQGIECARRTVAKYREALRIAPANLRRAL